MTYSKTSFRPRCPVRLFFDNNQITASNILNNKQKTHKFQIPFLFPEIEESRCTHEEADTRLVLHALQADTDVVVVAGDTDVLVIMVWAYHTYQVTHNWYMRIDNDR